LGPGIPRFPHLGAPGFPTQEGFTLGWPWAQLGVGRGFPHGPIWRGLLLFPRGGVLFHSTFVLTPPRGFFWGPFWGPRSRSPRGKSASPKERSRGLFGGSHLFGGPANLLVGCPQVARETISWGAGLLTNLPPGWVTGRPGS